MKYNYNTIFSFVILLIVFNNFIHCDNITINQLNLAISSYQNNVLKTYEEVLEFKNNGTVTKYNIFFNLKKYGMDMDKKKIEKNIEILKEAKENGKSLYKIDESKLLEEIHLREKSYLKKYFNILNIVRDTNLLYQKLVHMIKKAFIIFICVIIIIIILAVGIIVYITSPSCKKYQLLIDEKDKDNTNNSSQFRIVRILNNFMKPSEKKTN